MRFLGKDLIISKVLNYISKRFLEVGVTSSYSDDVNILFFTYGYILDLYGSRAFDIDWDEVFFSSEKNNSSKLILINRIIDKYILFEDDIEYIISSALEYISSKDGNTDANIREYIMKYDPLGIKEISSEKFN